MTTTPAFTLNSSTIQSHVVQSGLVPLKNIKNIIAIASAKGGVGKSTTTTNLALALAQAGARVGILDADIYGPSQPTLLNVVGQKPEIKDESMMIPLQSYGLQMTSIGALVDTDKAVAWRGPMVSNALQTLLNQTAWDNLDYLLIDMPPGTGDIQLTLAQKIPVTGAVLVTTPQDLALIDVRRGVDLFHKIGIPILGIVENMAMHVCSNCGHIEHIFGQNGAHDLCAQYDLPYLGSLPLHINIRQDADNGKPTLVANPEGNIAQQYRTIAQHLANNINSLKIDRSLKIPIKRG